jgi:hypothetical protein
MLNSSINDKIYKQKYLKYKSKYLELKEIVGGQPKQNPILQNFPVLDVFCEHLKNEIFYFDDQFKSNKLFKFIKGNNTFNSLDKPPLYDLLKELNIEYSNKQKTEGKAYSRNCTKLESIDNHLEDLDFPSSRKTWFTALITGFRNTHSNDLNIEFDDFTFNINRLDKKSNTERYFVEELNNPIKDNILKLKCKHEQPGQISYQQKPSEDSSFIVFADNIEIAKEQINLQHRLNKLIRYIRIIYMELDYYIEKENVSKIQKYVLNKLKQYVIAHEKKK